MQHDVARQLRCQVIGHPWDGLETVNSRRVSRHLAGIVPLIRPDIYGTALMVDQHLQQMIAVLKCSPAIYSEKQKAKLQARRNKPHSNINDLRCDKHLLLFNPKSLVAKNFWAIAELDSQQTQNIEQELPVPPRGLSGAEGQLVHLSSGTRIGTSPALDR
jgi:hypothetical protein